MSSIYTQRATSQKKYIQESTLINKAPHPIFLYIRYLEQCFDPQTNYLWGQKGDRKEYYIEPGQAQTFKFEPMGARLTDKDCIQNIFLTIQDANHNVVLPEFQLINEDTYDLTFSPGKGYNFQATELIQEDSDDNNTNNNED